MEAHVHIKTCKGLYDQGLFLLFSWSHHAWLKKIRVKCLECFLVCMHRYKSSIHPFFTQQWYRPVSKTSVEARHLWRVHILQEFLIVDWNNLMYDDLFACEILKYWHAFDSWNGQWILQYEPTLSYGFRSWRKHSTPTMFVNKRQALQNLKAYVSYHWLREQFFSVNIKSIYLPWAS